MTASVGIGPNRMLAKICSEVNKPDGITYLPFDEKTINEFMSERKIRDIPGIGSTMEQTLNGLGITFCRDVKHRLLQIYLNFNYNFFEFLTKASLGIPKNTAVNS